MFCFGTIPNIPCLVQTGYVVIEISPMVAPFENRIECVGTSQADDFWLEALAKEYLSKFDGQPEYVDVYKFLSAYQIELNYYDKAKHILTKLMLESFA